ncbi:pyruvate synthase gamma/delta subunits [Candidatus Scalindua japonica]|uniref:Pyruvate synthase gamma/delta subunits n=2 Tax=Candidatus Scalindua japonica TaxID=1284222 RepID=A0A286TY75_9BACT|nr:pyruvate synthase gamma/delta subunits [Candidatus Scalindua japonica]
MKTASRIVGTASFIGGYFAQDFPVYGAERRGAPIIAFTRLSDNPILERGIIVNPDINIIADETLLKDSAANVLQGTWDGTITFVNTHYTASHVKDTYQVSGKIAVVDITDIALKIINKPVLSSVAAASACKLTGIISRDYLQEAVIKELTDINLKKEVIDKNVQAALTCFDNTPSISSPDLKFSEEENENKVVQLEYADARVGSARVYESGNTIMKKTGNWRFFKPVIDHDRCSRCRACFVHCPHSCISLDESGYPHIDYDNCKGCFTCMDECPKKVITKEREVRAW